MRTKLIQLEQRVKEVEKVAREVSTLVKRMNEGEEAQPEFSIKAHTWYLAAKGLIEKLLFFRVSAVIADAEADVDRMIARGKEMAATIV